MLQKKEIKEQYNKCAKEYLQKEHRKKEKYTWTQLALALKHAAEETIMMSRSKIFGWFKQNKETIIPLINQRTCILHKVQTDTSILIENAKEMCRNAKKSTNEAVETAKLKWSSTLAKQVHNMRMAPKEAWKAVQTLESRLTGHHTKPTIMKF